MIFRKTLGEANVLSMVERRTRFAVLIRNNDRKTNLIILNKRINK